MNNNIDVSGVVPEKREGAISNLRKILENFLSPSKTKLSVRIIIPQDFAKTVDGLRDATLRRLSPYDPKRTQVRAVAKTIPHLSGGRLTFAVILDGAIFGHWLTEHYLFRLWILSHELVHVADEDVHFCKAGHTSIFSQPNTVEETLFDWAWAIWMEYHAVRFTMDSFEQTIREIRKDFPKASINYGFLGSYMDSLSALLSDIFPFLRDNINRFRTWGLTIEQLHARVFPRLQETLVLAAYASAMCDAVPAFQSKIHAPKQTEAYKLLLSELWPQIHDELKRIYIERKEYSPEQLNSLCRYVRSFFSQCGFELSNTTTGIYIALNPIIF